MTRPTHTPTPWTLDEDWMLIKGAKGEEVAAIHSGQDDSERMDRNVAHNNAALIVRAVNAYAPMREALELAVKWLDAIRTSDPRSEHLKLLLDTQPMHGH